MLANEEHHIQRTTQEATESEKQPNDLNIGDGSQHLLTKT